MKLKHLIKIVAGFMLFLHTFLAGMFSKNNSSYTQELFSTLPTGDEEVTHLIAAAVSELSRSTLCMQPTKISKHHSALYDLRDYLDAICDIPNRLCLFCKQRFSGPEALHSHIASVHLGAKIQCLGCLKLLAMRAYTHIRNHTGTMHNNQLPSFQIIFICKYCKTSSPLHSLPELLTHWKTTHMDQPLVTEIFSLLHKHGLT